MDIQAIDINKLKKAEYNPRKDLKPTDREYQKIKKSIQEFGYVEPIIINNDYTIIGGHQRLKVLKDLGYTEVQVVILDVDKTKEKALNIALNKISGEWDLPLLKDLLQDIDTGEIDIELTGFDNDEIEQLLTQINVDIDGEAIEDDFDVEQELENIEKQQETKVKRGDVWQLGKHRLLCGDSTNENDVKKLMDGKLADMVFTDPPYGISIVKSKNNKNQGKVGGGYLVEAKTYSSIIGDETTETAKKFYNICINLGFNNFIIWGGNYFTDFLFPSSCWVIWDKENNGNFADVEMAWTSSKKSAKLYRWLWNGMSRKGNRETEGKTRVHPTQKPVGLFVSVFKDFDFESCFDGFGGSGSTLIACEQTNRICYMMELDEKYCDVIMARWEKFTGKQAIKIEGGEESGEAFIK